MLFAGRKTSCSVAKSNRWAEVSSIGRKKLLRGSNGCCIYEQVQQNTSMPLIKKTTSRNSADFTYCAVSSRSVADILVCPVESRSVARRNEALWCFVESRGASDSVACEVKSRSAADLLVCFIQSRSASGWRGSHQLQGKIG